MRKFLILAVSFLTVLLMSVQAYAQGTTTITGSVKNTSGAGLSAVSVTIKNGTAGTYTDEKGNFRLVTNAKPPFTIVISSVGYAPQEINVTSSGQVVNVSLASSYSIGQEIVVSASRIPERILESPVSIERVNTSAIRQAPATSYYDIVGNLKGVDVTAASLTFKTPTTRGFNGSGNARFNQQVDGMDNQAPGLNFSVGSVIGLTELDVDNMELLQGASSALYGPGGMNGTLLINSKSPFKYQGLSFQVREGIMNLGNDARDASPYNDLSLRWAQKVGDKFAYKIGLQYVNAKDWLARDTSNYSVASSGVIPGTRASDQNYNGVNVYGDETSVDINPDPTDPTTSILFGAAYGSLLGGNPYALDATAPFLANTLPVSRTGYYESEVVPENTINFKISGGLYYKINDDVEASIIGYYGTGNSVYTGSDRYALKDLKMGQYKAELKAKNWFLRAYTTQENSGEAYNATVTTQLFNEAWKPSYNPLDPGNSWYPQYAGAIVGGASAIYGPVYLAALANGSTPDEAKAIAQSTVAANMDALLAGARSYADVGRPVPGSDQFNTIFDAVRSKPIPYGGLFLDRSDLWMYEGQYNFTDLLNVGKEGNKLEVLAGANFKRYALKSQGTLFADNGKTLGINETGAYLQLGQKIGDVLKLTASGRYDKNENFKGKFTPRVSAVITVAKNQNFRLSYQNAYRFPTTQNQWIDLYVGDNVRLIGGLPELREKYNFNTNPVYTQESFGAFAATGDPSKLSVANFGEYKPETANSFEAGYKGLFANKLLVDIYGYFSKYKDFLTRTIVIQDGSVANTFDTLNIYSVAVNSPSTVDISGWGASLEYQMDGNFFAKANAFGDYITNVPTGFKSYFNTPKLRFNLGFGNSGLGKDGRFGFNIIYRWQDDYFTESDFRQGEVPSYGTLDAQVSYKFPKPKILVKLGGTNLTNKYYITQFGNPSIGGLYYLSIGYNVF